MLMNTLRPLSTSLTTTFLRLSALLYRSPEHLSRQLDHLPEHTARLEHHIGTRYTQLRTLLQDRGLDEPVEYLLHERRAKLHRAAVLALLLLSALGTDDVQARQTSQAEPLQQAASPDVQQQHGASNGRNEMGVPATGSSAMLADWLRQQPGFPQGHGISTRITTVRAPNTTRLAACRHREYFTAAGARLWGRINIGERCTADAQWTIWHAVQVDVQGPALIARHPLAAGSIAQPADFSIQQLDWTRYPQAPAPVTIPLAGQELQRSLAAGQPLRAEHLRPAPRIRSGETVAAIAMGNGFRIATDAVALASGGEGQTIRVRTASGKVLTGMVEGKNVIISR